MTLQTQFEQELTNLGSGGAATVAVDDSAATTHVRHRRAQLARRVVQPAAARDDGAGRRRRGRSGANRQSRSPSGSPISWSRSLRSKSTPHACVVQLRSNPPQRDDDGRSYYELLVRRGGEIALARYRKENGNARQQIAATVTREVLLRLVGDFCAVLD